MAKTKTDGQTKVVPLPMGGGDCAVTIERLRYGGQIERQMMFAKFIGDEVESPMRTAKWNFICFSTQTIDGAPIPLASSSDSVEQFEQKLKALFDLYDEVIDAWVGGIREMLLPQAIREALPSSMLTDEEKKARSSAASAAD